MNVFSHFSRFENNANKDNVEFLYECEVRSWYSECDDEWDALPTFEPWPGRSYVDVEQSCVTELDSCHACHGMREVESGGDPTNVAEASVLVISSLMNIFNLPFNEQNMKFFLYHRFYESVAS